MHVSLMINTRCIKIWNTLINKIGAPTHNFQQHLHNLLCSRAAGNLSEQESIGCLCRWGCLIPLPDLHSPYEISASSYFNFLATVALAPAWLVLLAGWPRGWGPNDITNCRSVEDSSIIQTVCNNGVVIRTENGLSANLVVTGDTVGHLKDNPRCHQWRQS